MRRLLVFNQVFNKALVIYLCVVTGLIALAALLAWVGKGVIHSQMNAPDPVILERPKASFITYAASGSVSDKSEKVKPVTMDVITNVAWMLYERQDAN